MRAGRRRPPLARDLRPTRPPHGGNLSQHGSGRFLGARRQPGISAAVLRARHSHRHQLRDVRNDPLMPADCHLQWWQKSSIVRLRNCSSTQGYTMVRVFWAAAVAAMTAFLSFGQNTPVSKNVPSVGVFLDFDSVPGTVPVDVMKKEVDKILKPSGVALDWRMASENHGNEVFS